MVLSSGGLKSFAGLLKAKHPEQPRKQGRFSICDPHELLEVEILVRKPRDSVVPDHESSLNSSRRG